MLNLDQMNANDRYDMTTDLIIRIGCMMRIQLEDSSPFLQRLLEGYTNDGISVGPGEFIPFSEMQSLCYVPDSE